MKTNFLRLVLLMTALVFGIAPSQGQDLGAIKARMDQRLSKLDALKSQGAIGENNRGLVELRGSNAEAGDVVAAENRDREAVYAALAKQTGSSPETVARARAKQLAASSAAGVWIQKDSGDWYKK
jgi:uncharacterized protein YdbL (DUF1318 family)